MGEPSSRQWRAYRASLRDSQDVRFAHGAIDPPPDARKLKTLETENARLKGLLAGSMLDKIVLKDAPA